LIAATCLPPQSKTFFDAPGLMRYLLDTNVISDFLKHQPAVTARFASAAPAWLAISTVTVMEIEYGFERQPTALKKYGEVWVALQTDLHVLPYEAPDAVQTARIRAYLAGLGTSIVPFDFQLAGTALARGLTLVTHNTAEFGRVLGLAVEDWWLL
jgi:tRNA(fMet)-specific endonuclease VapC